MPRALRGRFEPLDHFVLGHLYHPWASLCPWVAARRKAVHWLAIGVRTKSRALRSHAPAGRVPQSSLVSSTGTLFAVWGRPWTSLGDGTSLTLKSFPPAPTQKPSSVA